MSGMIEETQARKALEMAHALAYRQWVREGYHLDLSEYQDAALDALAGCLARYHNAGKSFSSYAYVRMRGACQDAAETYTIWHFGYGQGIQRDAPPLAEALRPIVHDMTSEVALQQWVQTWPEATQHYAQAVLYGDSDVEYTQQVGISVVTLWKAKQQWRQCLAAQP